MEIDLEKLLQTIKEYLRQNWQVSLGIALTAIGITAYSLPLAIATIGLLFIILERTR